MPRTKTSRVNICRRRASLRLAVVCVCALVGTGLHTVAAQSGLTLYRQLAVELSQRAVSLQADRTARRELAHRAADLDPTLADPLIILSRLLQNEQQSQREREDMLRTALSADFVVIDREEAVAALAELLVRQERFQEALSLLDAEHIVNDEAPMERLIGYVDRADHQGTYRSFREDLNRLDRLYVTALLGGDAPWFAGRLIQRLRNEFPLDRELGAMDWRRSSHLSLGVLEWIDAMEQLTGDVPAEMYRELLRADPPQNLVPMLHSRYREAGGDDPLVTAVAALYGSEDQPEDDALHTDKMIWELIFQHLDPSEVPDWIERTINEIRDNDRVVLTRDADRDGFWEERYFVRQGGLSLWQRDDNQDGRVSVAVATSGESITMAVRREGDDEVIVVEFAEYPLVARVRWVDSSGGREWIPAQPVPFDAGLVNPFIEDLWNGLGRRVTVEADVFERFFRQRRSDASRSLAVSDEDELRGKLRVWRLIE